MDPIQRLEHRQKVLYPWVRNQIDLVMGEDYRGIAHSVIDYADLMNQFVESHSMSSISVDAGTVAMMEVENGHNGCGLSGNQVDSLVTKTLLVLYPDRGWEDWFISYFSFPESVRSLIKCFQKQELGFREFGSELRALSI